MITITPGDGGRVLLLERTAAALSREPPADRRRLAEPIADGTPSRPAPARSDEAA